MVAPLNNSAPPILRLQRAHWDQMLADVTRCAPEEACGLVGGIGNVAHEIFSVTNLLHSPVRYRMDPAEQIRGILEIERRGWNLVAIYHSHPQGPNRPSATDVAEATFPEAIYLIWHPNEGAWDCHGFLIQCGRIDEVPLQIMPTE